MFGMLRGCDGGGLIAPGPDVAAMACCNSCSLAEAMIECNMFNDGVEVGRPCGEGNLRPAEGPMCGGS